MRCPPGLLFDVLKQRLLQKAQFKGKKIIQINPALPVSA
jgi:hypothetical protein